MKKLLLSAAIAVAAMSVTTANAQQGFSLGVKGIPQFGWMNNSDDKDVEKEPKFGVAFGIGAGYNFTENMGVGIDVLYSMQGAKYEQLGIKSDLTLSYVKIPLVFTYNTGLDSSKKVAFIGKIGPQIGLLMNAEGEVNEVAFKDIEDAYSDFNFGAVVGAGARFMLSNSWTLDAGLRFDYEFTDAIDATPAGAAATNNMTLGLEVGLNYVFN